METPSQTASFDLLRLPAVMVKTTLSEPSIYRLMRQPAEAGGFPRPIKIGQRAVAWRSDDVAKWIESRTRSTVCDTAAFYSVEAVDDAA